MSGGLLRHTAALALLLTLATPNLVHAQPSRSAGNHAIGWTVVGAGVGFGIGLTAGLAAFDDAINSDRKVWTTAIVGAAVGGTLGYLIGRRHQRPAPSPSPTRTRRPATLDDREITQLADSLFKELNTSSRRAQRVGPPAGS